MSDTLDDTAERPQMTPVVLDRLKMAACRHSLHYRRSNDVTCGIYVLINTRTEGVTI